MATSNMISSSRRKLALIIGNNEYRRPENRLRHSINDANGLNELLKKINFTIDINHDLTNADMVSTINSFLKTIHDGDLVLFYFSGHGYQAGSGNYLMPIDDTNINTEDDVESFATHVEGTIDRFAAKNRSYVTIFILDCCRVYWPKDTPKARGTVEGKGLHTIDPPKGTFIQFACGANRTASDGLEIDGNGLFTKHLLKHIIKPNEDINQIFREIAAGVYDESGGKQKPLGIDGLMRHGHIYLNQIVEDDSEVPEFAAPDTYEQLYCEGRHCAKCGKCRDWYFTGDLNTWNWIRNVKNWDMKDLERWVHAKIYECFQKRDGAMCTFHHRRFDRHTRPHGFRDYFTLFRSAFGQNCSFGFRDACLCANNCRIVL